MYVRDEVPSQVLELAKRRIRELMAVHVLTTASLETILASAYLQGVRDAVEMELRK